ncbi:GT-D fold domain-containing glycosyltransferase [Paenibacillus polymyxa]|uniref:GT-D fold domain-containing glycosyltransferase n=1 Tax=Paenibacillus polymyxa TaxID=1406 RepID=UPI002AB36706|nr:GT-D fold domain-containing glycosyltransferase [Paenibacillus polymyxa]MDY7989870.1 GT-D fold domain-containing glycosyltransferase [Paenibacillus polymyxa]MDY8116771.1 GT-D fold domain-containing glycosyltransferase [Paenibacillus polymyxa]
MNTYLELAFSNLNECSIEESDFIHEVLSKLNNDDLTIVEQIILCDGVKVEFSKTILDWIQKNPIRKKIINDILKDQLHGIKKNVIMKLKNEKNLFRLELEDVIYSSVIIFSINTDTIQIHKRMNIFTHRTTKISDRFSQIKSTYPKILSTTESLNFILTNRCSISRFGDGELNLCFGLDIGFQKASTELKNRLCEVLNRGSDGKILITLPEFNSQYNNIINCYGELSFWENYWLRMYDNLKGFFTHSFYGNTDISRNSVFFENNLEDIKKIWDQRDVVFVIGKNGRFEIKPELFNNINKFKSIYVPPVNAFDIYPQILESCLKVKKDKLFLISAGPTATVLAYDLMNYGYQALDIGHLPNCYDQYLGIIKYPESIPHVRPDAVYYEEK